MVRAPTPYVYNPTSSPASRRKGKKKASLVAQYENFALFYGEDHSALGLVDVDRLYRAQVEFVGDLERPDDRTRRCRPLRTRTPRTNVVIVVVVVVVVIVIVIVIVAVFGTPNGGEGDEAERHLIAVFVEIIVLDPYGVTKIDGDERAGTFWLLVPVLVVVGRVVDADDVKGGADVPELHERVAVGGGCAFGVF